MSNDKLNISDEDLHAIRARLDALKDAQRGRSSVVLPSYTAQALVTGRKIAHTEYKMSFRSGFYLTLYKDKNELIAIPDSDDGLYIGFCVALPQGFAPDEKPKKKGWLATLFSVEQEVVKDPNDPALQLYDVVEVMIPVKIDSENYLATDESRAIVTTRLYDDFGYSFALNRILGFCNPSFPLKYDYQPNSPRLDENDRALRKTIEKLDLYIDSVLPGKAFALSHAMQIELIEDFMAKYKVGFNHHFEPVTENKIDTATGDMTQVAYTYRQVYRKADDNVSPYQFRPQGINVFLLPDTGLSSSDYKGMSLVLFEEIKQNLIRSNYKIVSQSIAPDDNSNREEMVKASLTLRNENGETKLNVLIARQPVSGDQLLRLNVSHTTDPWGKSVKNLTDAQKEGLKSGRKQTISARDFSDEDKRGELITAALKDINEVHALLVPKKPESGAGAAPAGP